MVMSEQDQMVDVQIGIVSDESGHRAVIWMDGEIVKTTPPYADRDIAMLYAKTMEEYAHELKARR